MYNITERVPPVACTAHSGITAINLLWNVALGCRAGGLLGLGPGEGACCFVSIAEVGCAGLREKAHMGLATGYPAHFVL